MTAGGEAREPLGYRAVRRFAGLLLGLFYRHVEIAGAERIPAGPLVLAANHQNAMVDPMLLLTTVPRRLRPLAKAPLFRYPLIGWLVRLAGALPVERRQDAGSDPARNQAMLREATAAVAAGGAVLIFPEGVSQAEPRLMPLRSGAARLALGAAGAAAVPVTLLPVGLVYHEPGSFRTGWALVLVGEPVPLAGGASRDGETAETAVREVTERLAAALRGLMVDAQDRRLLRLLHVAATIWEPEADPAARTAWMQEALRGYRYLVTRDPARLDALAHRLEGFAKDAGAAGWGDGGPARRAPSLRYALREAMSFLVGLPLAVAGLVVHALPYQLTRLVVRRLRPAPDTEATYKLVAGLVFYPVAWAIEATLAWRLGGPAGLGLFLVALGPGGFFALASWERLQRLCRETGGLVRLWTRGDVDARLTARRRALAGELTALSREVPESVLSARQP